MFIIDDFVNAWRGLRHSPGFLALAALVLALGLGATIFTYGVLNTTTQKPQPFPTADRLYAVFSMEPAQGPKYEGVPILDYTDIAEQQHTFEDFAGYYTGTVIIAGDGKPERYTGGVVSWNF